MKEKLFFGLVGRGRWGQNYINTIEPMSACTLSQEHIKGWDYKDILDANLDGVIVASSTDSHFKVALDLIKNGFNVLVEKPMVKTLREAEKLLLLAPKMKVFLVGHILLYDPSVLAMEKNIERIGNIRKLRFEGLQSPTRSDSTVLENWGPHPIYLALHLLGQNPKSVLAKQMQSDNVYFELKYSNNKACEAIIGSISEVKKRNFQIIGEKGKLVLDWAGSKKILYLEDMNYKREEIAFPLSPTPLEQQILEFIDCIKTGRLPKTPLEQGVQVIKIVDRAQKSLEKGFSNIQI